MIGFILLAVLGALGFVGLARLYRGLPLFLVSPNKSSRQPRDPKLVRQAGVAAVIAVAVLALTRWPAAALAAGAIAVIWPRLIGGGAAGRSQLEKVEAIAAWTESLRDTAGAAAGLEQAIAATVESAPPLLQRPLGRLVAQLEGRVTLSEALSQFGDAVGDRQADQVVAALLMNARQGSGGLGRILAELARTSRDELEIRRKDEHQKRSARRQAMAISLIMAAVAVPQILTSRPFIHAYSSFLGQLVLIADVAAFTFAMWRIRVLSEPAPQPRFLASSEELTAATSGLTLGGPR